MTSDSPEFNCPPSQRDIDQSRCEALVQYVNPLAGDIYRSALICFDRFSALREANIIINPRSNFMSGGLNYYGELEVHIGTEQSAITPRIKSRVQERFTLPNDQEFPDGLYRLFALAHELGHVVQNDTLFQEFYGMYDETAFSVGDGYEAYVYSDNEVLADYIATQIISNSQLGAALGIMPPLEEPHAWRQWGEQHRVDKTVELYGDTDYVIVHE